MSSSLSRRRLDPDLQPRGPASGVAAVFSLLLLGAVVAAVALFVLRTSPASLESIAYVEPPGQTIAAPEAKAVLPTLVPTVAPDHSATGVSGQTQAIAVLPTVSAPRQQPTDMPGPTPTPRAVVLPTVIPMTLPSPAATQPPTELVSSQPVAAFVEAPLPMAASAPQPAVVATEPVARTIQPANAEYGPPKQVSSANDNLQRAQAMQTNRVHHGPARSRQSKNDAPAIAPGAAETNAQLAAIPSMPNGPSDAVPNTSVSVPDANAIRDDVAARINAQRP